jgi:hypothetical protein
MVLNHGDPRSLIIMLIAQNSMQQITMHAHISYNTSSTNWKQTKIVTCEGIEPFRLSTTTQVSYKTRLFKYKTTLSHNIKTIWKQKIVINKRWYPFRITNFTYTNNQPIIVTCNVVETLLSWNGKALNLSSHTILKTFCVSLFIMVLHMENYARYRTFGKTF